VVGHNPASSRIKCNTGGILASTTGYVDGVTGYVKQRMEVVLLQEQGRLLLVGP
jgi:cystathionine beta-lyase family protein involved in aluminum resistance